MVQQNKKRTNCGKTVIFDGAKEAPDNAGGMPPEDRREEVLDFLEVHRIALPPKAIYRALKLKRGINFSYGTVKNALSDLERKDYVTRVSKEALNEGRIETISGDTSSRRAYYMITSEGVNHIEESE